ncbi:VOC family protein [Flavobacterium supellecticarium]|uniref:VOC family protein n=1 Tax=Flavobacterium supellecticarium TaxID=2565924 RepID=A0A4S3ZRI1_9FLAO|nr:VOC family protein [Flavobacterium supellecticarium]THF48203.1 VOC family protein [Flavobacterium supellecticarium]
MDKKEIKRVTGIGGFFFKCDDPNTVKQWYRERLGIPVGDYGWSFAWKDEEGNDGLTQWSPFAANTRYFEPSEKQFMMNFRVENLVGLLEALKAEGVTVVGEMEEYDYGKFGWVLDPEGNKIELWEPK